VEDGELRKVISRAVNQLPKRQKKVFVLRHYEGLALKEIAVALNCSLGTVKAHLFRATRRMRKLLMPYVSQHA
jgi:RNA polymerase sigma-70 factor (ECF subfamily)